MRLKVPRPAHQLADPIEQENWKKKLEQTHKQVSQKYPDSEVEIWAMDEQTLEDSLTLRYRLGLKPILRNVDLIRPRNDGCNGRLKLSIVLLRLT